MTLTNKSIEELRQILQEDSRTDVTQEQARKFGKWILQLYSHLTPTRTNSSPDTNDNK